MAKKHLKNTKKTRKKHVGGERKIKKGEKRREPAKPSLLIIIINAYRKKVNSWTSVTYYSF
jgi:hypothetical protein